MTSPFALEGPQHAPTSGKPQSIVVLLHGYGADGNDLISLAPLWARLLPQTLFVSPHAPFPCEINAAGRQWFGFEGAAPEMILAGTRMAATMIDSYLDSLMAEHGVPASRIALVGFSQGGMMSLHVAPRRSEKLAGVVSYSGALVAPERLAEETKSRPPILMVHGDADPVVPFASLARAAATLKAAGFTVDTERRPGLPHAIDQVGMARGARFLVQQLGTASASVS